MLIPARGGSRRLPRKNVRPFLGVPAIQRVIRTLQDAGVFDRIIVSTDDGEIAQLAKEAHAEVPGRRPARLADDHTTTISVVRHAIEAWMTSGTPDEPLWVIYPTALLLPAQALQAANERYLELSPEFLYSVLRYRHPIERRLILDPRGRVRSVQPEHAGTRTQDLVATFHDAGQFYVGSMHSWRSGDPLSSDDAVGFELPRDSVVDIDEPADWAHAEALANAQGSTRWAASGWLD